MSDDFDIAHARDLFGTVDLNGSGYIDKEELAAVCDLDPEDLGEVFNQLDADKDGRISIEEFSENFKKFKNVVSGLKQKRSFSQPSTGDDYEELKLRLGKPFSSLTGHEYVTELFHHMHNEANPSQMLSLLESFLFSVVRDIKNYESENQKLEEALKRTCEKHAEHMDNLNEEMEQQLSKMETRVKKEEQSKFERSNMDVIWQMENKNKEIQALQTRNLKLESILKRKEPEEQKLKEEIEERVQEIRYLRSQMTDSQTNTALLRSELAQLRSDYEDQTQHLQSEKRAVMECVQEQESLTRQLQLLHEANKKLHDANDDLRSALESRRGSDAGRSPSPNKRNSITTLYSASPRHKRTKSNQDIRSPVRYEDERLVKSMLATPLRSPLHSLTGSRKNSLLPSQQTAEMDEPIPNEDSLMLEISGARRHSSFPDGTEEEDEAYGTLPPSERENSRFYFDMLAETNKRLLQSNDDLRKALEIVTKARGGGHSKAKSRDKCRRNPSFHSDYGSISSRSITPNHLQKTESDMGDGAEELSGYEPESDGNNTSTMTQAESLPDSDLSKVDLLSAELEAQFKSVKEEDEEDIDEDDVDDEELAQLVAMADGMTDSETETESDLDMTDRQAAVGAESLSEASTNTPYSNSISMTQDIHPERMFKLVLAGDAAVGKSSFILRLCRNKFHSALNSTLGVDFQMKTLVVDNKHIALQLWDTAGQERFRSIAKSYFRKADGVLLLYDVTCETSFLDVRDWVEAIEESCSKPVPIMLCGNKTDLRQTQIAEGKTVISTESGQRLAKEYGALFTETSAKENQNVTQACMELARILQTIEDNEITHKNSGGMQLTDTDAKEKKKSTCCVK